MTEENPSAFKLLINKNVVGKIAKAIAEVHPSFDQKKFNTAAARLDALELKKRVQLLRDQLYEQLPQNYPQAVKILKNSLTAKTSLRGFELWPYTEFIQTYGLDYPEISLRALYEITGLFTSEFGVRPFIIKHQKQTLDFLLRGTQDKNVHIRRWASEGSRPRLPWGERLHAFVKNPAPTLPILEKLKYDEELYVRKSVANHLNDIAKDHPDLVITLLKKWQKNAPQNHAAKVDWIIRRALRTLIKDGNSRALSLIGAAKDVKVKLQNFKIDKKIIKMNERMTFEFDIHSQSKKSQKLVVDYIIHFRKANKSSAPKVFKFKTLELGPQAKVSLQKTHHIKKITTRQYHPGEHFIEIQVNGKTYSRLAWTLKV